MEMRRNMDTVLHHTQGFWLEHAREDLSRNMVRVTMIRPEHSIKMMLMDLDQMTRNEKAGSCLALREANCSRQTLSENSVLLFQWEMNFTKERAGRHAINVRKIN
ncbi:hypothetical protein JZ751_019054 [Albula glossodonta]|uniref:Uncharacterized protein n=1 Tax=Albula glossodonta TaxID=121402 RepID=A0A8T2NVL4_9TELE|nr:hypothetical protein JZ751_019054 [Albula glossodonta]